MEKKKILLDNNGIKLVAEHFSEIYSKREKFEFYICHTVFEEFTNTIDFINKNDRFIVDKSRKSDYFNLSLEKIVLDFIGIENEADLISEIKKFNLTELKEELCGFIDRKIKFKSNLYCIMRLEPKLIDDSIFILGYSKLGTAGLGVGDTFNKFKNRKAKYIPDSVIVETAVNKDCKLLTDDEKLKKRMVNAQIYETVSINELLKLCM